MKTIHEKRAEHSIEVGITDPVLVLFKKLEAIEPEQMQSYHTRRLVYPMGRL